MTSKAIEDVVAERDRQKFVEGWVSTHDDEHDGGTLAGAGAAYAISAACNLHALADPLDGPPFCWPHDWDLRWWKPTTPRRDLVKAAALIIAEIERLDRL